MSSYSETEIVDGKEYIKMIYEIVLTKHHKTEFTDEEKTWCRPIAETLAMLDGNAFFGMDLNNGIEWYEQYLPEAWALFNANGGYAGWPSKTSWMKDMLYHETQAVEEAYKQWRVLKSLSKISK